MAPVGRARVARGGLRGRHTVRAVVLDARGNTAGRSHCSSSSAEESSLFLFHVSPPA